MSKSVINVLAVGFLIFQTQYYGSTTAPVVIAGGVIKAQHSDDVALKYKRKDCPVCKGKGWYMSGDGILKIDCTYCEADKGSILIGPIKSISPTTPAPKIYSAPLNCPDGNCPLPKNKTIRR